MKELEQLYRENYAQVFAFCLSLTHDRADAEDLAAETFFRAIEGVKKFRGECRTGVWLCSIARNAFLNERKKRRRPPPPAETEQPLCERLEDGELACDILAIAEELDEPYRGVFLLRTLGETDFADISEIYSKSESWARVTYHRSRLKIIKKLEKKYE